MGVGGRCPNSWGLLVRLWGRLTCPGARKQDPSRECPETLGSKQSSSEGVQDCVWGMRMEGWALEGLCPPIKPTLLGAP